MDLVKLVSPTGVVVKVSGDRVEKYLKVGYKLADKTRKSRARKKPAGNEDD